MITLHGASASPFVRKTRVALALKNLPYEHRQNMPYSGDEELKKVSPLQKIPALVDGELTVADSKVICRYLEAAYPEVPVYPDSPVARARAEWIEEYAGSVLTEAAAGIFFHRFMRPVVLKQEVNEEAVTEIIEVKLPPMLDYLESQMPAEGFLFGDFGVADMALASPFVNAGYADYRIDPERWPLFAAFVARVNAHSAVAPILAEEAKSFGG